MNNNIEVVIKLCDEDRARLDRITALLEGQGCKNCGKEPQQEESRATTQAETKAAPVAEIEPQEAKEEAPAEPEKQAAPDVSLEQLQGLVMKLVIAGKKNEARDLVHEYAKSATDVPADKRGELYARLQKLEA